MAYAQQSSQVSAGFSTNWFASAGAFIKLTIRRRVAYQKTVDELSQYTDRELADIGLSRSMIPAIAREASRSA